jgi:transposase InsO family protein
LHTPGRTEAEIEARVVEHRQQRPDWGARKIQVLLKSEGVQLPVVTIHRILLRQGLVHDRDRHRPAMQRFEREAPNQLWQMDYKGLPEELARKVMPLSILDDHSRYLVGLYPLPNTGAEPLLKYLETVLKRCGVPDAILIDHGTPWWNAQAHWGLTRVSLWLMKQDIELLHSAVRHPQTQGKVESSHRAMQRQLRSRGWPSEERWAAWLQSFAEEWNNVRPHEALGYRTPADYWQPSARQFQPHPKQYEYGADAKLCHVREHGQITVFGRAFTAPQALAGEYLAAEHVEGDRYAVRYRRTLIRELDLQTGRSTALPFQPYCDLWD